MSQRHISYEGLYWKGWLEQREWLTLFLRIIVDCGVWIVEWDMLQEQVTLYMNTKSQCYSHSTLLTPHSSWMPCSLRAFALITHGVYGVQYFLTWIWQFLNRNLHATGVEIWRLGIIVVTLQRIRGYALRVKAAAQHSSSELGSAFALHFPCSVKSQRDNKETKRQVVRRLEGPGTWRIGDRHKN